MNTLDIVLTNTISYMLGIFTGMFISYYVKDKDKKKGNDVKEKEKDYDDDNNTDKYTSPIQAAMAYPSAPPTPLALNPCVNPEYSGNKKITITTE